MLKTSVITYLKRFWIEGKDFIMSVANVVMYEFETKADLEKWADWYKNDGPFPNNEISLFVQTGETSAFGIATYPSEEAR